MSLVNIYEKPLFDRNCFLGEDAARRTSVALFILDLTLLHAISIQLYLISFVDYTFDANLQLTATVVLTRMIVRIRAG